MVSEISPSVRVILCTAPQQDSERIVRELLERRLVACVNIMPVRSLYRWEGHVCDDREDLLIIKTEKSVIDELIRILTDIHPYEVPEVIVLPVEAGFSGYLDWVAGEIR